MNTKTYTSNSRDGLKESPWQGVVPSLTAADRSQLDPAVIYDCLIVGGGITGLSAAVLLQTAGKKVVLADAFTIGFGTTGGTSAHINTFADTSYKEAESGFGTDGATLFAQAINKGSILIKQNVETYRIDCDYENRIGYIYAENDDQARQLDDVYEGTVAVGVAVQYTNEVPAPIPFKKALLFDGQAQFHPVKYLQGLKKAFVEAGGTVLENTRIEKLSSDNGIHVAGAGALQIKAGKVIYATHIPPGITSFNFRCAPYRSYVLAVKLADNAYPDALIYDMEEPYHYLRTHIIDDEPLLLVGGNDHKTGHDDPEKAFADLENYVRKYYNVSAVKYGWSSQYYVPVDGLPYIGQMPEASAGVYCATGYNGNGMMLGSIAAKILSDLVSGKENKYADVFSPARIKPIAGFTEFVKENADAAYHFVADRFKIGTESLNQLPADSGKVMEVDGKKIAVYRDTAGTVHALNPVCTHAKCIVNWNQEEKSWDCPCHGARYDIDGKVLNGPADKDLQKISENE
jgi:glycine/D-amino acid oxidase-like deaminating enzyme/nitrite reductase/ring-hydroxylating ferredoxin subunit